MKNKHECYCILDSDPSFTPVKYHACCDINEAIPNNKFKCIGLGVVARISGRQQSGTVHKKFYIRVYPGKVGK